jgi:hypothetical protein
MEKWKKNALINMLRLLVYCSIVMAEMEREHKEWSLVECCHILSSFRRHDVLVA